MDQLQLFYLNTGERESFKAFLIGVLEERAVEKVFSKQATAGIYEARKVIDEAFQTLEEMYAPKVVPIIESSR